VRDKKDRQHLLQLWSRASLGLYIHLQTVALGDPLPMQSTRLLEARGDPSSFRSRPTWAEVAFGGSMASSSVGTELRCALGMHRSIGDMDSALII
jgi:hypothetical protein